MSEATVTSAEVPTIILDPNTQKPAPPAPAPPTSKADKPEWLDARLAEATASGQSKVLKELGVETLEDAKKAIEKLQAAENAQKSDAQKAADYEVQLKATKAAADTALAALGEYAKTQMAALTEDQRKAVAVIAGDDSAKQLSTIRALTSTWASAAAPAATPPANATVPDTAPPAGAPRDAGTNPPIPNLKAIYEQYRPINPVFAARFALANGLFDDDNK